MMSKQDKTILYDFVLSFTDFSKTGIDGDDIWFGALYQNALDIVKHRGYHSHGNCHSNLGYTIKEPILYTECLLLDYSVESQIFANDIKTVSTHTILS